MRLGIIGGGRAAWAFGSAWRQAGWPISGIALRPESGSRLPHLLDAKVASAEELASDADVLLVAVTDRAIPALAASIVGSGAVPFHPSGAVASDVFSGRGFSLHPLKALPPVGEPSDLAGTLLVFEGPSECRPVAREIASAVRARFAEIDPRSKPLYHAAAVFGSNYVAAMLDVAHELMTRAGLAAPEVRADLARLAQSAIENWTSSDDAGRFTGPAARGDREIIERHIEALAPQPEIAALYRELAARITSAIDRPSERRRGVPAASSAHDFAALGTTSEKDDQSDHKNRAKSLERKDSVS
ncbi:MAG TPA: DUF2520 domain-containing protein [Thermoanaerobaculia bacterium]|nr:DUF2520 domain-containing protein [Thermoanaerobaculia bacterium]